MIEKSEDVFSRLNFAYIQARYVKREQPKYMKMLVRVLKESLGVKKVYWNEKEDEYENGYIDHQSAYVEGQNMEMFASEEELKKFLFSEESYIQTGNDNTYY